MPGWLYIATHVEAAWHLIRGRSAAVQDMDLSNAGFWNSFVSRLIAVPALGVSWMGYRRNLQLLGADDMSTVGFLARMAIHDVVTWLVPLALLILAARPLRLSDRIVAYVVAGNWASVIFAYGLMPIALINLIVPPDNNGWMLVSLLIFATVLALDFRVMRIALDRPFTFVLAVYLAMMVVSFTLSELLQAYLGLSVDM